MLRQANIFAVSEPQKQSKESLIKTVVIPLGSPFLAALGLFGKDMPVWPRGLSEHTLE